MKFHLLIVDDEVVIRKGLSDYINWDAYDCQVTATASNGKEAMEIIENNNIDIVLTDIKMPVLDGIGLAEYVYENHPDIAVIILSGYSEFEYAQSAIKYQVNEYILKPAAKEKIIESVQNVAQKLITSRSNKTIDEKEFAYLKDTVFQELTDSSVVTEDIKKRAAEHDINLNGFYVAAFQLVDSTDSINLLKDTIIDFKSNGYCYRYNNLIITIYYETNENYIGQIVDNCNLVINEFYKEYNEPVFVGISEHHNCIEEFAAGVSQAISALSLCFYSSSHIVTYTAKAADGNNNLSAETTLLLHDFETAIIQLDFKKSNDIASDIFIKLQSSFADEDTAVNICFQIYYICYRVVLKSHLILPEKDYSGMINNCSDIFQLKTFIGDLLNTVKQLLTQSTKKYSDFVQETISYIQDHIAEDLSLEVLAKIVNSNESYLSRTFKKECGISIINYITTLRIALAKDLLAGSTLRTFEIADSIGIHDAAYFSSLFKKNTGLSPKEYRNQFIHQTN
jgi:hypothetical protein